jgi:hypothetical protein
MYGVALAGEPLLNGEALFPGTPFHRISSSDSVLLLIGDSHADHLLAGLVPEAAKHGFGVSHVGYYGCPGVHFSVRLWGPPDLFEQCQALVDSTFSYFLRDSAVKIVVLAARGNLYTTGTDSITTYAGADLKSVSRALRLRVIHEGYSSAIRRIEATGRRVVLFLDVPELFFDPQYCDARLAQTTSGEKPCAVPRQATLARQSDYRAVVQRLQRENPLLVVFDPMPLLCDDEWCYAKRDSVLMYGDNNHVNQVGSRLIAESLGRLLFNH